LLSQSLLLAGFASTKRLPTFAGDHLCQNI
jgi:hypothetical protein